MMKHHMEVTEYHLSDSLGLRIAVVADLHEQPFESIYSAFHVLKPDLICLPGDFCRYYSITEHEGERHLPSYNIVSFFEYALSVAPVFCSRGNLEYGWNCFDFAEIVRLGVHVLENGWEEFCPGFAIGGLASSQLPGHRRSDPPKTDWLEDFGQYNGFKLLLSHHPEYYEPYIKPHDINLVISGHAHGGQIRLGTQGVYAPGQGLFPKLTAGIHDDRLIICRGISRKPWYAPCINNPPELVYIEL